MAHYGLKEDQEKMSVEKIKKFKEKAYLLYPLKNNLAWFHADFNFIMQMVREAGFTPEMENSQKANYQLLYDNIQQVAASVRLSVEEVDAFTDSLPKSERPNTFVPDLHDLLKQTDQELLDYFRNATIFMSVKFTHQNNTELGLDFFKSRFSDEIRRRTYHRTLQSMAEPQSPDPEAKETSKAESPLSLKILQAGARAVIHEAVQHQDTHPNLVDTALPETIHEALPLLEPPAPIAPDIIGRATEKLYAERNSTPNSLDDGKSVPPRS